MTDLVAELEALIVAWRARRTSELALLIDELSAWFELVLPELDGATLDARHAAWMQRARTMSSVDLPVLVAKGGGTRNHILEQLEQLTFWEPDPRTTHLAQRMLARPHQWGRRTILSRLLDVIERHGDPGALPLLRAAHLQDHFRDAELVERVQAIDKYIESKRAEPDPEHATRMTRLRAALESGRVLRDAAVAGDLQSRGVYVDWLMDRGYTR